MLGLLVFFLNVHENVIVAVLLSTYMCFVAIKLKDFIFFPVIDKHLAVSSWQGVVHFDFDCRREGLLA